MKLTRRAALFGAVATIAAASTAHARMPQSKKLKWVAFYGERADETVLAKYDIVVLDPSFKGSLAAITKASPATRLCAYLSLGESRESNPFHAKIAKSSLTGNQNQNWGSWYIDVRDPAWTKLVLEEMIPSFIKQGFTGVMLDTLDTPAYLEERWPGLNPGMRDASIELVKAIRTAFPDLLIIMNRGYVILPRLLTTIDAVIAESLMASPVANNAPPSMIAEANSPWRYEKNDDKLVWQQMLRLQPAKNAGVPILSLDYWKPNDRSGAQWLYVSERLRGHHPYVATRDLDIVVPEPV